MAALKQRLPQITAALVLSVTGLELFRDLGGMQPCRDRGVGAYRRKLGPQAAPANANRADLDASETVRDETRVLLSGICKLCPHNKCSMKRWHIR